MGSPIQPISKELHDKLRKAERELLLTIAEVSQKALEETERDQDIISAILTIQTIYLHSISRLTNTLLESIAQWVIELNEKKRSKSETKSKNSDPAII